MTSKRRIASLCIAILAAPPSLAFADGQVDAAKGHLDSGVTFYEQGQYEAARIEFEAGYQLSHRSGFLFNLAKVAQKQGKLDECRTLAKQYEVAIATICVETRENCAPDPEIPKLLKECQAPPLSANPVAAPSTAPTEAPVAAVADQRRKPNMVMPALLLSFGGAALVGSLGCALATFPINSRVRQPITQEDYTNARTEGMRLNAASGSLLGIGLALGVAGATWMLVQRYGGQHKTP